MLCTDDVLDADGAQPLPDLVDRDRPREFHLDDGAAGEIDPVVGTLTSSETRLIRMSVPEII